MGEKYLSEFYSYRAFSRVSTTQVINYKGPQISAQQDGANGANYDIEHWDNPYPGVSPFDVKELMTRGDEAFFKHKYYRALHYYLFAWGLFPKSVDQSFAINMVWNNAHELLNIDIKKQLIDASAQTFRFSHLLGPTMPIISPGEAPEALVQLSEKYGGKIDKSTKYYNKANLYIKIGIYDLAQENIKKSLEFANNNEEIQANAKAILGAIEFGRGNYNDSFVNMQSASDSYKKIGFLDSVAAMQHNLGVLSTLKGDMQQAGRFFNNSLITSPSSINWQVTHSLNPGISSTARPMGKTGLPLIVNDGMQNWVQVVQSDKMLQPKQSVNIIKNNGGIQIDLKSQDSASKSIVELLLKPRIKAQATGELQTYLWDSPNQLIAYIIHVHEFILPMSLGDTYFAIGDYEKSVGYYIKARDYDFLNMLMEGPMVWCKLARSFLELGNQLYRRKDVEGAQSQYKKIVGEKNVNGETILEGPLYTGAFASFRNQIKDLFKSSFLEFNAIDIGRRQIILEAIIKLNQIENGINYLGFSDDVIPIHSWRYLQNLARYFANQAIQAEREYINFEDKSEQEEFQRLTLEQAAESQKTALDVEELRVAESQANVDVYDDNLKLAQTRLNNGKEQKKDLMNKNEQEQILDEMMAWIQQEETWDALWREHEARDGDVRISRPEELENWYEFYGHPAFPLLGFQVGQSQLPLTEIIARVAIKRSQLTHDYELGMMGRQVEELGSALTLAQAQKDLASASLKVAEAQRDLAKLNLKHAEEQLEFFNTEEFTPELWDNLAQTLHNISRQYLDWAIGVAFLMERAFEFEYDTKVGRIRFDYEKSELHGLLAGDFLLTDIDHFSYDRILETEKRNPVVVAISLANRYPYLFREKFQKTGHIDFETALDDFDRWFPGSYLSKLRQVDVVVEGLIASEGLHGTLTNSGISYYRDRKGKPRVRLQKPETMILSQYSRRADQFAFSSKEEEGVLGLFENSGVASGWILNIPPEANDVNYDAITDVHLLFHFDAYHSESISNIVRAEMAASSTSIYENTLGLGLRFQYPDEFFGFQDSGEITFTLTEASFSFDHTNPTIMNMSILIQTEKDVSAEGLTVNVNTPNSMINIVGVTNTNGMIFFEDGSANADALKHKKLTDTWTVKIDKDINTTAFSAGFKLEKVKNIFFFFKYAYTPRGRIESTLDLSLDPLQSFDVVDDPMATTDSPSNWTYNTLEHRIEQVSNIHGPDGNANMNSNPEKPGTYLLHKTTTTTDWHSLKDLVIHCQINSGDEDGIGLIFRYQDADNFYFFIMDSKRKYRRIGKKLQGVFQELDTPAVDKENGYNINQDYKLTVAVVGDAFKAYLDGEEILSGQDRTDSLMQQGRVGFYSWANTAARFLDLRVQSV